MATTISPDRPATTQTSPFNSLSIFLGRKGQRHALKDATVVSADNHLCLGGDDFFYDNAPAHLKDRVPRIWFDKDKGFWIIGIHGKSFHAWGSDALIHSMEAHEGAWNVEARLADMDSEGIDMEVAFPQSIFHCFHLKDFEAREYIFREYNRHLARLHRKSNGRFYGVGIGQFWKPAKAREFIQEMKQEGLKTLLLPGNPGVFEDGRKIQYASDEMRPLWEAIVEAEMPLCFHVGENVGFDSKGGLGVSVLAAFGGAYFRTLFGQLVYGGIFDEFPTLKVAFVEANLHWIPGMLQDAELIQESYDLLLDPVPKLTAQAYWDKHCYATFMYDPAGFRHLDRIGADKVMWSCDYPHNESTFGYTGATLEWIVSTVGEEQARKIVGGNAIRFFGLETPRRKS